MAKNITLMGASYSNVPAVQLPQTGGGTARFDDASVTTATASDVASGKIFLASDGTITTGTNSGGGGDDFIVTLSYNDQTEYWEPDCTYSELYSAYSSGKTIAWLCDDNVSTALGYFNTYEGYFEYSVYEYFDDSHGEGYGIHGHAFGSTGITDYGVLDKYFSTYDGDAEPSDVANGKIFFNADGIQTGTASGGGASNFVTGEFTVPTYSSSVKYGEVSIPYTGNGYPISALVFVKGGVYNSTSTGESTWYTGIKRYAVGYWSMIKSNTTTAPDYNGTENDNATVVSIYKNSTSVANNYTRTSAMGTITFSTSNPASNGALCIIFRNNVKTLRYSIGNGTASSYGLYPQVTYVYQIVYSE